MTAPLTHEREQEITALLAEYRKSHHHPFSFDCCSAHAVADAVPTLLAEIDRLRDELAETKAMHDPRLRGLLVKAAPDKDLYVQWSTVCDMPGGVFSRETALEYGFPRSKIDHADAHGSSSRLGDGAWDDKGWVAEQRGWLRRDRIGDYALLWLADRQDEAFDLLEPFEGESEVRR